MISSEVPTAIGISTPSISTSAGMIRKPPPTPNSPVNRPTAMPERIERGAHRRQLIPWYPDLAGGADVGGIGQHPPPGDHHHDGEAEHDRRLRQMTANGSASEGGRDAGRGENSRKSPLHLAGTDFRNCARGRGDADHDQRDREWPARRPSPGRRQARERPGSTRPRRATPAARRSPPRVPGQGQSSQWFPEPRNARRLNACRRTGGNRLQPAVWLQPHLRHPAVPGDRKAGPSPAGPSRR